MGTGDYKDCELDRDDYIKPNNGLNTKPAFVTGVIKIQRGLLFEQRMTAAEKDACRSLLKEDAANDDSSSDEDAGEENFEKAFKKARREEDERVLGESKYISTLNSLWDLLQLWSEEDALMTKRRQGTYVSYDQ